MISKPASREQVFEELTTVFRDVFDNDQIVINDTMTAKDLAQWDSLNHINLVISVEQRFAVKFLTAEIARLQNVGQFVDLILKKFNR